METYVATHMPTYIRTPHLPLNMTKSLLFSYLCLNNYLSKSNEPTYTALA